MKFVHLCDNLQLWMQSQGGNSAKVVAVVSDGGFQDVNLIDRKQC